MQVESEIAPRPQHRVHLRRKVRQHASQVRLCASRLQFVQVVDYQHEATRVLGEVREDSIDHCLGVEARRRDQRVVSGSSTSCASTVARMACSKARQNNCSSR